MRDTRIAQNYPNTFDTAKEIIENNPESINQSLKEYLPVMKVKEIVDCAKKINITLSAFQNRIDYFPIWH